MVFELEAFSVVATLVIVGLIYLMLKVLSLLRKAESSSAESTRSVQLYGQRFAWIYEHAPEPLAIHAPDGRLVQVNQAWHDFMGISREEFPEFARTFNPFTAEHSVRLGLSALMQSVVETGMDAISLPILWDFNPEKGAGAYRWVAVDFRPILTPGTGEIDEVLVRFVDMTERTVAAQEAKRLNEILKELVNNSHAVIFVKDLQGKYLLVNRRWSETFGISAKDVIGRTAYELFPAELAKKFETSDREVVDVGHGLESEELVRGLKGDQNYFTVKFPIRDQAGTIRYTAGIATDITGKKKAEAERTELLFREKTATEASLMKSAFLANMSHELRTPIHGIMGMADLLDATELGVQQKDFTNSIMQSAESLLTLVNDILDLSKAEAGKIEIESLPVSIHKVTSDVETTLRMASWKKGIDFKISVDENLPEGIQGDPTRIRQVLMNLASNAIKFTASGEVRLQASIDKKGQLFFEVLDTGIGISEAALPRLFSAFSQADASTTRRFGGTGLGLSISKHLVTLMGGEIGVERRKEGGTRFWFWLPLKTKEVVKSEVLLAPAPQAAPVGNLRILVAEDNATNQMIVTAALRNLGHTPIVAGNGEEAIKALRHGSFDLVFMDCQMPVMDGYEATRSIRQGAAADMKIPIIALTANAMRDDMEKCLAAGMNDYISKPAKTADIKTVIGRVMSQRAREVA